MTLKLYSSPRVICGIWKKKKDTNELIYKTEKHSQVENKLMVNKGDSSGGSGKEINEDQGLSKLI